MFNKRSTAVRLLEPISEAGADVVELVSEISVSDLAAQTRELGDDLVSSVSDVVADASAAVARIGWRHLKPRLITAAAIAALIAVAVALFFWWRSGNEETGSEETSSDVTETGTPGAVSANAKSDGAGAATA